jgi:hypothetical protein
MLDLSTKDCAFFSWFMESHDSLWGGVVPLGAFSCGLPMGSVLPHPRHHCCKEMVYELTDTILICQICLRCIFFWYNMPFYNMHYEIHKWHLLSKNAHMYWHFGSVCTNDLNVEPILKLSWDMPGQASGNERDNTYIVHVSQSSDPPAKAAWMLWLWVSNMVSGIIQFQFPNHIWTSVFVAIPCFQNHLHQSGSATHSVCVCVCVRVCVCGVPICGLIGKLLPLMWQNPSCSDCLNESSISTGKGLGHPGNDPRHFGVQGPHPIPNEPPKISGSWSLQAVFVLGQSDTRCAHSILEDAASEAWGISDFH